MDAGRLHEVISAVCPIDGVSVVNARDRGTWSVAYSPTATPAQIAAAKAILASVDDSEAAGKAHAQSKAKDELTKTQAWVMMQALMDELIDAVPALTARAGGGRRSRADVLGSIKSRFDAK